MKKYIFLLFIIIPRWGIGQDFIKSFDKINNIQKIVFADQREPLRIPIIINKTIYIDSNKNSTVIDIGIYRIVNLVPTDFFMRKGGNIVFEDGTNIKLEEEISNIFLSGGKHQIAIRHKLSMTELKQLQSQKIDFFVIGNVVNYIDKFEREFLKTTFLKIEGAN